MPRFNKNPNPSCITNTTGWVSATTLTRLTGLTGAPRSTGVSTTFTGSAFTTNIAGPQVAATSGQVWTMVGWVRANAARNMQVAISTRTAGGAFVASFGSQTVAVAADTWTQVRVTGTLSGTFAGVTFTVDGPSGWVSGNVMSVSSVRYEQTSDAAMVYADGDTAGWVWDGTVGSSTSTVPDAAPVALVDPVVSSVSVSSPGGDAVEALTNIVTLVDDTPGGVPVGAPASDTIGIDLADPTPPGQQMLSTAGGELVNVAADNPGPGSVPVSSPGGDELVNGELLLPDAGRVAVSFFVVDRATNGLTPLPHHVGFDISPIRNSGGTVQIEYPKRGMGADLLWPLVDDDTQVEVEIWIGNRSQNALRAILTEGSADDTAETASGTFTGQFLECLLDGIQLRYNAGNAKGETVFSAVSPGSFAKTVLDAAAARGTLTGAGALTYNTFTATTDSAGNLWSETITGTFSPGQSLLKLFQDMAGGAVFEFEVTAAREVKLYKFGTRGRDRTTDNTPTVLRRGLNVVQASRKRTSRAAVTDLEVYGKDNLHQAQVSASARSRYGRRIEGSASAGEINNAGALTAYAQKELELSSQGQLEITCGLLYGVGAPTPVDGFNVADLVLVDLGLGTVDRPALEPYRVVSWSVTDTAGAQDGTITVNDLITDLLSRLRQRLDSVQSGSVVIGTSAPNTTTDTLAPAAPVGLVASSIAYQDVALGETYARVTVGWTAVTTNTDGSAATDVAGYRVRYAYLGLTQVGPAYTGAPEPNLHYYEVTDNEGVHATSYAFGGIGAGVDMRVQVRAFDNNGNQGPWSVGIDFTTEVDNTAPGIPSRPTVEEWIGTARPHWDGTDEDGAVMADAFFDFDHVEWHRGLSNNFTVVPDGVSGTTFLANQYSAGTWNDADLTYGVSYFYRLVSVDRAGNRSTPSLTSLAVIPRQLVSQDLIDDIIDATKLGPNSVQNQHVVNGAITTAKIGTAQIVTALIADLQVNNAKVADLSAGKLTAGTLTADIVLAGIIRTALTGARGEFDNAGLRLYTAANVNTVNLKTSDGSALITGTYQSAMSGERINILPDGSLRFYPAAGSNYSRMANEGNDIVFRGPLDANQRSGRVNVNTIGAGMNFSAESELSNLRAEVLVLDRVIGLTSPNTTVRLNGRQTPTNGLGERYCDFLESNSSGTTIASTVLRYRNYNSRPGMVAPGSNAGWKYESSTCAAVDNTGLAFCNVTAASYGTPSSRLMKRGERDIAWATADEQDVIVAAPAKTWQYLHEVAGRAERPGHQIEVARLDETGEPIVGDDGRPVMDVVDADWDWDEQDAPWHFGPMAEDLAKIAPSLVRTDLGGGAEMWTDLRDLLGVVWGSEGKSVLQIRQLQKELAELRALVGGPRVVEGEVL